MATRTRRTGDPVLDHVAASTIARPTSVLGRPAVIGTAVQIETTVIAAAPGVYYVTSRHVDDSPTRQDEAPGAAAQCSTLAEVQIAWDRTRRAATAAGPR